MPISIDWGTQVISIPRSDMILLQSVPTEIRELDLNSFRLELKDIEDSTLGMTQPTTHNHVAPIGVGGVTLARVVELINGYTVTFEDGQYAVNLSGANTNLADKVNVNQVSVRSSNSAGLVQTSEIEYSSFQNAVTIDIVNGKSGQAYPLGTAQFPVNNLTDAKFISQLRGFDVIKIKGNFTFETTDIIDNFEFIGQSSTKTYIGLTDEASITNCVFRNATVSGFLDGNNNLTHCRIEGIDYVDGNVENCEIGIGDIVLNGELASFINCYSGVPGGQAEQTATIDLSGGGTNLIIRNYTGGMKLINNAVGDDNVSIDILSGQIVFDSTITAGTYTVRGIGKVVDNSSGTAVVNVEVLDSQNINRTTFTDGGVYLQQGAIDSTVTYPHGTPAHPINNMATAIAIARREGLTKIFLSGFFMALATDDLSGITVIGGSGSGNVLLLQAGVNTVSSGFEKLILAGQLGGLSRIVNCILGANGLGAFTECEGRVVDSIINTAAGITQKTTGAGTLFENCSFITPNDLQVTVNANGKAFSLRKCTGHIIISNATSVEAQELNLQGGRLEIDASCTAGSFYISGDTSLTNNTGGTTVIDASTNSSLTTVNEGVKKASLLIPHNEDLT